MIVLNKITQLHEHCNFCNNKDQDLLIKISAYHYACINCVSAIMQDEMDKRNKRCRVHTSSYCCANCGSADIIDMNMSSLCSDKNNKFVMCKSCGISGPAGFSSSPDFVGDGKRSMTCECGEQFVDTEIEHPVKHRVMRCLGCGDTVYTIEQSRAYHAALIDHGPAPKLKKGFTPPTKPAKPKPAKFNKKK